MPCYYICAVPRPPRATDRCLLYRVLGADPPLPPLPLPHRSLSDKEGNVVGGHVVGNLKVFTTCELVLLECAGLVFAREFDPRTGFKELVVAEAG